MSFCRSSVSYTRTFVALLYVLAGYAAGAQAPLAPSIQICGGDQVVCLTEPIVELCTFISIPDNYAQTIDSFQIDFADGNPPLSRPATYTSFRVDYLYDFTSFFGSCEFQRDRRFITLRTYLAGSDLPVESIFPFTGQNPPQADFGRFPEFACAGEAVTFDNASCPVEELNSLYDFGDGSAPSEDPAHVYAEPGDYLVTLEVFNDCARDTISSTITIVDLPIISSVADSGFVAGYADPYLVCLSGTATVKLDASASIGFNSITWSASPSSGVSFENRRAELTRATFSRAGNYTLRLTGRNEFCSASVTTNLQVEVRQADLLRIDPQEDVCISLDYCPSPQIPGATYTLNGTPLEHCDQRLGVGTYVLEAFLADPICGDNTLRDTFRVLPQDISTIDNGNLILCDVSDPVQLTATPRGGEWTINGIPFDGLLDPAVYTPGEYTIGYGREPCLRIDTIRVSIRNSTITVPEDTALCLEDDPVDFAALPAGGVFSGRGITPEGTFDPGAAGEGTFTLRYTRTEEGVSKCSRVDSFEVVVTALSVDFTETDCLDAQRCFAVVGDVPYDELRWQFPGGYSSTGPTACYTFPGPGNYSVSLTAVLGNCRITRSREVTIAPPPVVGFALDYDTGTCGEREVKIIDQSQGENLTYEWMINGLTFSNAPTPDPFTPPVSTSSSDTTYVITLRLTDGCAVDSLSDTIRVITPPVAGFGVGQLTYCSGDTMLLANTSFGVIDTYEWRLDGEVIGTDSLPPFLLYDTDRTDTLELCLTAANSCEMTVSCQEIVFTPASVTAFFRISADTVCVGDTVRLTNAATAGVPVRYDLGNGDFSDVPDATVVYQRGGTYRITQRAFGCGSGLYTREVTVRDLPTAAFAVDNAACPGLPVSFTNGSTAGARYRWDFGDGSVPQTEADPQHTFAAAGTYRVCLTVTSLLSDGCSRTICQEVTVNPGPTAGFEVTDSVCLGTPVRVATQAAGSDLFCTYVFGEGGISTDCVTEYLYAAPGTYRLTQRVTDSRGCMDSLTQPVVVGDGAQAVFEVDDTGTCGSDTVSFRNLTVEGGRYLWDFGDGDSSSLVNPVHIYSDTGSYLVRLTVSNRFCNSTVSRLVTVQERPVASIAVLDPTVCLGAEMEFANVSTGSSDRQRWDFGDGTVSFEPRRTHTYAEAGSYRVRLRVESVTGCADSTDLLVTVWAPPTVDFSILSDITCPGGADGGVEAIPTSGQAPFTYTWSNGSDFAGRTDLTAGTYTVTLTGGDGCSIVDSVTLAQPPPIEPAVTITDISCRGESDGSIVLQPDGGTPPLTLAWADGLTDTLRSGLTAGTYALTVTDAAACTRAFAYPLEEPAPLTVVDSITAVSCYGHEDGSVTLTELSGGVAPYTVRLTGPGYQRTATGTSRFDQLRPGTYLLEVEDANGCLEEREIMVPEPDSIRVNIALERIVLSLGDSLVLSASYSAPVPRLQWSPPIALSCTECTTPVAQPEVSQEYTVLLTDANGCTVSDSVFVELDASRDIYLPNTFTPNGDGRNDIFRVRSQNPGSIDLVLQFQVWDRWGMLVYSVEDFPPNDPAFGWDGNFRGERVSAGQYVYKVQVRFRDGFEKTTQGGVLVIR